jgi:hypothetical protein
VNIAAQRAFVARVLTCPATQGLFELTDLPTDSRELAEIVDQHIDLFPINEEKTELSSSWFMAATRFNCFNILQAFANRPYFLYRLDSFQVAEGYPSPIQEAIIVCEAEGRMELAKQLRALRGIFSRTIFYVRSVLDDLNAPAGPSIYDLAEVRANGHG